MPRNGSGTYNLPPLNPVVGGTTIQTAWGNNTLNDIATALSNSIAANGETTVTANIPMAGHKITGLADGTADADALAKHQLTDSTGSSLVGFIQSGTGAVATTVNAALLNWIFPEQFGAVGDGTTDDSVALQKALTAAFVKPGGTVFLSSKTYSFGTGLTLPDTAGAVRIVGMGRPNAFSGGVDSDPAAMQGSVLKYTGNTGDVISSTLTGSKRQYITLENFIIYGNNSGGISGNGVQWITSSTTCGFLVCYRDFTVVGAKGHGIFHNGNVFETTFYNVRLSQNGGCGFKAAANGATIPGETRFYGVTSDSNASYGIALSGGGLFSLHGVSITANGAEGLIATAVNLIAIDLNLEVNGTGSGNQALFTSCNGVQLNTVRMTTKPSGTGIGLSFVSCFWASIIGYQTDSSGTGGGYKDFVLDDASNRCSIHSYYSNDFVDRYTLGQGGGNIVKLGNQWKTGQSHNQQTITLASGNATPNAIVFDDILINVTGAVTITITNPTEYTSGLTYHQGQILTMEIYNNSGGVIGINWGAQYALAGAFTVPANGKIRTIQFHWNATTNKWVELNRAAADI